MHVGTRQYNAILEELEMSHKRPTKKRKLNTTSEEELNWGALHEVLVQYILCLFTEPQEHHVLSPALNDIKGYALACLVCKRWKAIIDTEEFWRGLGTPLKICHGLQHPSQISRT